MPTGNTSLTNPSSTYANSTHNICLFNAHHQLKTLTYSDLHREEKLYEIEENLKCALEKNGKKIEKNPAEDSLNFIGRIINKLNFFQMFSRINVNDTKEAISNFIQLGSR
ncbi:MAG: hypothetical protein RJA83_1181 [Pseudomonadota bacterium]|jgi:hypothetical protein